MVGVALAYDIATTAPTAFSVGVPTPVTFSFTLAPGDAPLPETLPTVGNRLRVELTPWDPTNAPTVVPDWSREFVYYAPNDSGLALNFIEPMAAGSTYAWTQTWTFPKVGQYKLQYGIINESGSTVALRSTTIAVATARPSVIEPLDGGSRWSYADAYDATDKREGGYLAFNGGGVMYASDGASYDTAGGWVDQAAYLGKGPHGGYDTTTNKCKTCHATHRAEGSYYLLRATSSDDACTYCHIGGGAHSEKVVYEASSAGIYTENGHTMGAGSAIPDSTISMESQIVTVPRAEGDLEVPVRVYDETRKSLYRIVGYGRSPAGHPTFNATSPRFARVGPTSLSCSNCHQTHNATALIWRPQPFDAVTDITDAGGFLAAGYKLLRRYPGASALDNPVAGAAINGEDLAKVPESRLVSDFNYSTTISLESSYLENAYDTRQPDWVVSGGFAGGAGGSATVVNQYTLSVWCADCHNLNIGGTAQEIGGAELGFSVAHAERTHPVPSNAAFGGTTGGFQCYSCHRADLDYGSSCNMCHYSAASYRARVASVGTDFPHAGTEDGYKLLGNYSWATEDNSATNPDYPLEAQPVGPENLDAVCIRCHNVDQGGHPPYGEGPGHAVPAGYETCVTCHGADAAAIHEGAPNGCDSCHSAATLTFDCNTCHPAPHADADHTVPGSACTDCHNEGDAILIHGGETSCNYCHRPGVTPSFDCASCHLTPHADADHTVPEPFATDCTSCHNEGDAAAIHGGTAGCVNCHGDGVTPTLVCATCHATPHATADHTVPEPYATDCTGCHDDGDAAAIHGGTAGCANCHADGITPTLVCSACHTVADPPHSDEDHSVTAPACTTCHDEGDAIAIHDGADSCDYCHGDGITPSFVCADCHDVVDPPHSDVDHSVTAPACTTCHDEGDAIALHAGTASGCDACHGDGITPTLVCATCHTTVGDPPHSGEDHTVQEPWVTTCLNCHTVADNDGADLHASAGCDACHGDEAIPSLVCTPCHEVAEPPHSDVDHTADVGADLYMAGFTCEDCHDMLLSTEHDKTSSSSTDAGCATCHPTPRDSFTAWNQGCEQGGCHATGSATEAHTSYTAAHANPAEADACMGSGCHSGGNLAAVHTGAGTGEITSCLVCHAAGVPATNSCIACHPGRDEPHGYDPAQHTASLAGVIGFIELWDGAAGPYTHEGAISRTGTLEYCASCHVSDLALLHPAGCSTCHPTPYDTIVGTWNGTCSTYGCHPTYHDDAKAIHNEPAIEGDCGNCHTGPEDEVSCFDAGCHP